jgi:hypothetical protein
MVIVNSELSESCTRAARCMISFAAFHRRGSENASRIELKFNGGVYLVVHCTLGAFLSLPDARDVHNERWYFSLSNDSPPTSVFQNFQNYQEFQRGY